MGQYKDKNNYVVNNVREILTHTIARIDFEYKMLEYIRTNNEQEKQIVEEAKDALVKAHFELSALKEKINK